MNSGRTNNICCAKKPGESMCSQGNDILILL